ncbi:MAG: pyrroline-5-carboxylate reductase [Clostridiales bacterium]
MFSLGFLGGGQMAETIIGGLKEKAAALNLEYLLFDPIRERRTFLHDKYDVSIMESNEDVIKSSSVLFLAVKPQIYPDVEDILAENYRSGQIIISLMAGIPLSTLSRKLPNAKIIRIMPNTAMSVGAGVCLVTANEYVDEKEKQWVVDMLSTLGKVEEIKETIMNGAMAISASGPAFFYTMIESLVLGGIEVGLTKELALSLANQTMLGAAKLLISTDAKPSQLRDAVLSPGGTTIEGVRKLEAGGFRSDIIEAVVATAEKGVALGNKSGGKI